MTELAMFTEAVKNLLPNTPIFIEGTNYEDISILDDTPLPEEKDVLAEYAKVKQHYQDIEYQRQRTREYPSIGDQLDALFKAGVFPEEMSAQIQSVKDKYPKP